jgi:hypothetical protein
VSGARTRGACSHITQHTPYCAACPDRAALFLSLRTHYPAVVPALFLWTAIVHISESIACSRSRSSRSRRSALGVGVVGVGVGLGVRVGGAVLYVGMREWGWGKQWGDRKSGGDD